MIFYPPVVYWLVHSSTASQKTYRYSKNGRRKSPLNGEIIWWREKIENSFRKFFNIRSPAMLYPLQIELLPLMPRTAACKVLLYARYYCRDSRSWYKDLILLKVYILPFSVLILKENPQYNILKKEHNYVLTIMLWMFCPWHNNGRNFRMKISWIR